MSTLNASSVVAGLRRSRYGLADALLLAALAATFAFGQLYLALATTVLIMVIFALSLDLAQGYGGIETLGHAAFFGSGAYAAGLYALHVSPEPISGLLVGAAAAAVVGLLSGLAVLRTQGLTQIMLTLACATLLYELANTLKRVTMGDDGLSGYTVAPLLGRFEFDIFGRTAFVYAAVVLAAVLAALRFVVNAPLGLVAQGIRDNPLRMRLLGVPVTRRLLQVYGLSAAVAGVAGALSAQVNRIVGLDTLGFVVSANVLVMLALGGAGRLYGAVLGAVVFVLASDRAAAVDPANWLAALGLLLIVVVRFAPEGLAGLVASASRRLGQRRGAGDRA
ncbi:MAG TPA: branched-chain amino acid ABC transporter permease [Burkholderiaceae bacterium]|nr:branched-chain amino acid ABC transporter permease [Burkholderiaceae bacterium]